MACTSDPCCGVRSDLVGRNIKMIERRNVTGWRRQGGDQRTRTTEQATEQRTWGPGHGPCSPLSDWSHRLVTKRPSFVVPSGPLAPPPLPGSHPCPRCPELSMFGFPVLPPRLPASHRLAAAASACVVTHRGMSKKRGRALPFQG